MANPLQQLRSLIRSSSARMGRVSAISADGQIQVSTRSGVITARRGANDSTQYRAGDTVVLSGTVLQGRAGVSRVYRV